MFNRLAQLKPQGLIITSGTLSPLDGFEKELGIPLPHKLCNKHVIKSSQIFASVLEKGINRERFDFTYLNRDNPKLIESLGLTLVDISQKICGGILVFFPSYGVMIKYRN